MKYLMVLLSLVSTSVSSQIEVQHAWSRATPPGAKVAAGYVILRNKAAAPDRLVGASSSTAARVETHVVEKQGEVMRMREVKGYDVPAKGSFELKPGGPHLMFVDIKRPFKEGEKVPVVLRFQNGGEIKVDFEVRGLGASKAHGH